jgi:hypothetical protein
MQVCKFLRYLCKKPGGLFFKFMELHSQNDTNNNFKKEEEKVTHFFRFLFSILLLYMLSQEKWMGFVGSNVMTTIGVFGLLASLIDNIAVHVISYFIMFLVVFALTMFMLSI